MNQEQIEKLKSMKIKAIVFDADGVVINSPNYWSVQYEKEFGVSNDIIQPFFKNKFQECLVGKADLKEELNSILNDWQWKGSVDGLLEYWFRAEHFIDEKIIKEIEKLKDSGIKCSLGALQEKYRAEYIRKNMGFDKIFDKTYFSCDIGYKKPEKEFFEFIQNDLSLKPEEIMFWDDKKSNIDSAKEMGWQAYHYTDFEEFKNIVNLIKR